MDDIELTWNTSIHAYTPEDGPWIQTMVYCTDELGVVDQIAFLNWPLDTQRSRPTERVAASCRYQSLDGAVSLVDHVMSLLDTPSHRALCVKGVLPCMP